VALALDVCVKLELSIIRCCLICCSSSGTPGLHADTVAAGVTGSAKGKLAGGIQLHQLLVWRPKEHVLTVLADCAALAS
jgi:hypothetical protein